MGHVRSLLSITFVGLLVSACSSSSSSSLSAGSSSGSLAASSRPSVTQHVTVTLLAHDSFAVTKSLIAAFKARTGITIKVVTGGDAGEVVNKAVLTAGNPEGDVLFGVDNTLLTRALQGGIFQPYVSPQDVHLRPELKDQTGGGYVTPVDYADVCVDADDKWFIAHHVSVPKTLAQLAEPAYKKLLVVENPATSSPGLAFLLATVARYGDPGWRTYWKALKANGVQVDNDWNGAYYGDFSGAIPSKGSRPLVVSYSTDPAADIIGAANPKPSKPNVSVMTDSCFRQIEYAGVLKGTKHAGAAGEVVDWLVSPEVQADVTNSMYVLPARENIAIPEVFQKWTATPPNPLSVPADEITANRSKWIDEWTEAVEH
jgi:thiamine transport system substrate-binding protein